MDISGALRSIKDSVSRLSNKVAENPVVKNVSSFLQGNRDLGAEIRSLKETQLPKIGSSLRSGAQTVGYGIQNVGNSISSGISKIADIFPGKNNLVKGVGDFFGKGLIGGYGRTVTSLGNKGVKDFSKDIAGLPKSFKEKGFMNTVSSQEFEDVGNLMDIVPMGFMAGTLLDSSKALRSMGKADETITTLRSGKSFIDKVKGSYKGFEQNTALGRTFAGSFRSAKNYIKRSGPEGEEIFKLLESAKVEGELAAGKAVNAMNKALKALDEKEASTLADVIEGIQSPASKAQAEAARVWRELAKDVANTARSLGLKVKDADGSVREFMEATNFFPRYVDDETFEMLEKSGTLPDFLKRKATRRYGHLEFGRMPDLDEVEYKRTPDVLLDYLESAYKRLSDAAHFGQDDAKLYELADKLPNGENVTGILDRILQREVFPKDAVDLSKSIRSFQTVTKLDPASSIVNLGQNISTAIYTNPKVTVQAALRVLNKKTKGLATELALESGEIMEGVMKDYYSSIAGAAKDGFTSKYLKKIGFAGSELFNKTVATNAGIIHAENLFKKLVRNEDLYSQRLSKSAYDVFNEEFINIQKSLDIEDNLIKSLPKNITVNEAISKFKSIMVSDVGEEGAFNVVQKLKELGYRPSSKKSSAVREALTELGLDPDKLLKYGLTHEDKLRAGKRVSEVTQFSGTGIKDLPYFWSSPHGKVVTQFKQFAFKQAGFIRDQITRSVKEAKKGNFRVLANTLATAGIGGNMLGEIINDIKSTFRGNSREDEEGLERYLNNVFAVVSLGLFSDVGTLITGQYGPESKYSTLGGPTVSDIGEGIRDVQSIYNKGDFEPTLRSGLKRIPAIGRPVESYLFDDNSGKKNKAVYR